MKSQIIAGLDIGSHSLKMVVAQKKEENGGVEILGVAQEPSSGVRRGAVVNGEELALRVLSLKQRVENLTAKKISHAVVNIGGSHITSTASHGIVAVSRADHQISPEDVERVLAAAQTFSLPSNKEILEAFPQQFSVDGEQGVKEPVGMKGVRLEADVIAICAFSPYLKNLTEAVLSCDVEIEDIVPSPLACSFSALVNQQKELGVALLDVGAQTTNLAVFEEGDLVHLAVFPVGSESITNDIAIGLRTEHDLAERIKKEFGTLGASRGKRQEKIDNPDGSLFAFSPKLLFHIVEARTKEIFQFVQKELKKIERTGKLPSGIVLAGGGAKLPRLDEFAKKELKLPSRLGTAQGVSTFETDPVFLGAMGLCMKGLEGFSERTPLEESEILRKFKKFFKVFIP
jgi:cell division protein FtsA